MNAWMQKTCFGNALWNAVEEGERSMYASECEVLKVGRVLVYVV